MPPDYAMPFSDFLGVELIEVTPERVVARMKVRPELCTRPAVLHGGAVMALADTLGGVATVANLAAVPEGETATAECTALHRGKTTMVWQTKISREDGRIAAYVTQTQLILAPR